MSFYADFCLSIQTPINTIIASRVDHLLSMIQLLLQAQLRSSCLLPAKDCHETQVFLNHLQQYGNELDAIQPIKIVWYNTMSPPRSCASNIKLKVAICLALYGERPSIFSLGSFQHFLLVVLLPHMNDTLSISMYKELQNHQLLSTSSVFL